MSRGFTLLEILLAITLTVSVGIAALSLTIWQARVGAAARTQEEALALLTETGRLLDDDLLLAVKRPEHGRFEVQDGGALRLVTACRLPGEPPGLHEVLWRYDPGSGGVLRTSIPLDGGAASTRRVGRAWRSFAIALDQDGLWLDARIGDIATPWRRPLWSEAR